MSETDDLWTLERRLWLDGTDAFRQLMAPDCVMAFPGMGVIAGEAIIDGLQGVPRWVDIEMAGRLRVDREAVAVIAYLATARREGQAEYRASCVSTWVRDGEGWRMLAHQHTPL